ncbi:MAG: ATP-binding protein [Methyloceanibacter sp.]|jgi:two-component system cell cycle sensor histidine kinase PleC
MARARPARGAGIYSITGPRWQDIRALVDQHLPSQERLRQLVPILVFGFLIVASLGFNYQIGSSKDARMTAAQRQLALNADIASLKLRAEVLASGTDWQGELAQSLPLRAAREGRVVLLSDAAGSIQARVPIGSHYQGNLLTVLGPGQPLTIMGADAGVMRIALNDGTDALVTVRNVPRTDAQLTFIQPVASALAGWRSGATIEVLLLICGGLLLMLFAGAFWYFAPIRKAREPDALTRELTEAIPGCGVWRWNLARGHIDWSPPMYALLGLQPDSSMMSYGTLASKLHRDDDLRAELDRHLREGLNLFDQCFRLRHADGHWVTTRLRGHITRDADTGEPYLTGMAVMADPNAVPGAADANARLRDAVETISEAFVLWDNHNRLVMCNSKYQQFHGLADDMVQPGSSYDEVIAAASEPIVSKRFAVANKNDHQSRTYEAQLEDGRWLHINERRTRDGGYVSVGTDITDLKQSQTKNAESEHQLRASVAELRLSRRELEHQKQQLVDLAEKYALEKNRAEAANRAKSEFLANISHELRTPLNAIIGFSEVMQQSLFGPLGHEKYQEYARDIYSSGEYLLEVINDILDMSKIEAGRMTLDLGDVDVADIVQDSMKVVSQAAAERGIALERQGPEHFPIQADRRYLKQIFLNLLSNAVKFSQDGGRVDVRLTRSNGQLKIAIKDTGIGIAQTDIAKLGRPFEQVENQFSKSHQGSGLGLAISRALVELHGGTIEIKSREGYGTTVTCSLPIRTPRPANVEEPLAKSA